MVSIYLLILLSCAFQIFCALDNQSKFKESESNEYTYTYDNYGDEKFRVYRREQPGLFDKIQLERHGDVETEIKISIISIIILPLLFIMDRRSQRNRKK
jgi:hypothetical protein